MAKWISQVPVFAPRFSIMGFFPLTNDQHREVELFSSGQNIFLTEKRRKGKSIVIRSIVKKHRSLNGIAITAQWKKLLKILELSQPFFKDIHGTI